MSGVWAVHQDMKALLYGLKIQGVRLLFEQVAGWTLVDRKIRPSYVVHPVAGP